MIYKQSLFMVDLTLSRCLEKDSFFLSHIHRLCFSFLFLLSIITFLVAKKESFFLEMGNCQAVDAAALVLQHPDGKIDRYYGPVSVAEIMRLYPGHYVSLIIPLPETNIPATSDDKSERRVVKFTRVKLLRPTESLVLGHAYRLITSQEVMKVLRAKKYAKTKKHQSETSKDKKKPSSLDQDSDKNHSHLEIKDEKQRGVLTSSASSKSKTWRPSLQSISEATS